ncbi:MAG: tetratricopeptide repeat protein [Rhodoferax sp.]|nr:tetratricopeptide repeat protein [Rhodoferax sp.]
MKHAKTRVFSSIRIAALALGLATLPAHADEYADVSQLVRAGKLAEALGRAEQFLAAQPKDPQMRFIKGVIQRDSGKTAEAIATFTKLTEDFPELPEPHNNLAVMYASQSQFDKARAELELAIRTNPSYATAHENLGDIYAKLASQAYNKALQLDTGNQAVAPKLALIREIFTTNTANAARVASISPPPLVATAPAKPVPAPTAPPVPPVSTTPPKPVPPPVAPVATPPTPVTSVPTAPAPAKPAAPAAMDGDAAKDVEAAAAKWASVWSARDVKAYLAACGIDFDPPGSMGSKDWEEERQLGISSKPSISVKVDKLSVSVNGSHAVAKFRQDYKAGGLPDHSV